MKDKKISVAKIVYVVLLLLAIIILFYWYTSENSRRIVERNKNYAADASWQKAERIDEELRHALKLVSTYTYFIEESLTEPGVSVEMLKEVEKNSQFDAVVFTDQEGTNYASDGHTSSARERDYYLNGIRGESGISVIFDSTLYNETMLCFYAPVRYQGEIIGVLRGAYLAEEYLKDMLSATYFGEEASVHLCLEDGTAVACSDANVHEGDLLEILQKKEMIDSEAAKNVRKIFEQGGSGAFLCGSDNETNNICAISLPKTGFVLVQTFPKSVTQEMIRDENAVGIKLEIMLVGMFAVYIVILLFQARRDRLQLEIENREMGYIINGVNTLFSRFTMVDLDAGTYQYLAGTRPEDSNMAVSGGYEELTAHLCSLLIEERDRIDFAEVLKKDAIIEALQEHDDLRFENYVMRSGRPEWEHVNVICLERKDGAASKVLFIRQNITEVKETELLIQQEMAVANRKERQYRIAVMSNAICTFEFNLTKDVIDQDVVRVFDGERVSMLEKVGLKAPCKASELFARWKLYILEESREEFDSSADVELLKRRFAQGEAEVSSQYWIKDFTGAEICVRQSFLMTKDDQNGDIMVMVIAKEITESVRKQKEQTQALQDALMQAQHANRAKTTFLSNMSHDIRTPMNAIIGFATIAASHIDSREQVRACLQKVLSSSNHLLSLINDILDMSRIESGKVQIKEQDCNISELMHNLVNIIQPQIKAKQLELFIDTFEVVNEDVVADSLKLNQVFINLLSNAVKYTPAGGTVSFRIMQKTTFRHGYGDYIFVVKDNGIGMSKEFVRHIFEPFERESSVTRSGIQGTGLGMAITKNIIDMMGGTIEVESETDKGSTFTVEFSLKLQDIEKNAEPGAGRPQGSCGGRRFQHLQQRQQDAGAAGAALGVDHLRKGGGVPGKNSLRGGRRLPHLHYRLADAGAQRRGNGPQNPRLRGAGRADYHTDGLRLVGY